MRSIVVTVPSLTRRGGTHRACADQASIASRTYVAFQAAGGRKPKGQFYRLLLWNQASDNTCRLGASRPASNLNYHLTSLSTRLDHDDDITATQEKTLTHQLNAYWQAGLVLSARHAQRRQPRERRRGRENVVGVDAHALFGVLSQP